MMNHSSLSLPVRCQTAQNVCCEELLEVFVSRSIKTVTCLISQEAIRLVYRNAMLCYITTQKLVSYSQCRLWTVRSLFFYCYIQNLAFILIKTFDDRIKTL